MESNYYVALAYSCDWLSDAERTKRRRDLRNGGDLVTKVLKHFGIGFGISMQSDFHHPEPILENVTKRDARGNEFTLYTEWGHFSGVCGESDVLRTLESLGVIPCSVDEAAKLAEGKNE